MKVPQVSQASFSGGKFNRSLLQKTSKLASLNGPQEVKDAKKLVAFYSAENAGVAALAAQFPCADELALSTVEVIMASAIINGVYGFKFSSNVLDCILAGIIGERVGTYSFKAASKLVTWIPGFGNVVNSVVAGGTTAALGAAIIKKCENMDAARKRGEKIDEILKGE